MNNHGITGNIDKLFRRLFSADKVKVPDLVKKSFRLTFAHARNAEWTMVGDHYESLFYLDGREQIAHFDPAGAMCEYRVNIPVDDAPKVVLDLARQTGELMNVIRIEREEKILYELIARDKELNRYLILMEGDGALLKIESF